ncbi:MAG: peptide deformylase [Armatimonadetes bacterium]|nr:peptide deformylase [Armatimonadota bacterium]
MPPLPIKLIGDPVLRTRARKVEQVDAGVVRLLEDMVETMYQANGIGLAAPQVGVSRRVIVVDVGDGPIRMVNPRIVEQSGELWGPEGCLSIPGILGEVKRFAQVVVKGLDEEGAALKVEAEGLLAVVFQHEIDHLDGVLFVDLARDLRDGTRQELVEETA